MAKCNRLTPLPFKGLIPPIRRCLQDSSVTDGVFTVLRTKLLQLSPQNLIDYDQPKIPLTASDVPMSRRRLYTSSVVHRRGTSANAVMLISHLRHGHDKTLLS